MKTYREYDGEENCAHQHGKEPTHFVRRHPAMITGRG